MSFILPLYDIMMFFFFSSRRRHTRCLSDWSSDVCSSDLRVNLREPSAHLRHDLGLRQRRANHQGRVTVGTLIEWKEHRCPWSLGERIVLSIFDDADNFVRKFFAPQKPAPKGGGVSKHRAGEGLVHDRDLRALGIVMPGEVAPTQQTCPSGLQIAG